MWILRNIQILTLRCTSKNIFTWTESTLLSSCLYPLKWEMKCPVVHLRNVGCLQRSIASYGPTCGSLSVPPGLLEICELSTHSIWIESWIKLKASYRAYECLSLYILHLFLCWILWSQCLHQMCQKCSIILLWQYTHIPVCSCNTGSRKKIKGLYKTFN